MIYTEAKEKIEAMLSEAKAKLDALGIDVTCECELVENKISEEESEPLLVLGSLALTMDGLTEDDTYYISVEAKIEEGAVSDEAFDEAVPRFNERVESAYARLADAEDKKTTLIEMGKEIDAELERLYEEEVARAQRAMKRDLKLAIIGTAIIVGAVVLGFIIKALI